MSAALSRAVGGLSRAAGLTLRRLRVQAPAWVLPLWALAAATPSYESVYPSPEARTMLIGAMRTNAGTRIISRPRGVCLMKPSLIRNGS